MENINVLMVLHLWYATVNLNNFPKVLLQMLTTSKFWKSQPTNHMRRNNGVPTINTYRMLIYATGRSFYRRYEKSTYWKM